VNRLIFLLAICLVGLNATFSVHTQMRIVKQFPVLIKKMRSMKTFWI